MKIAKARWQPPPLYNMSLFANNEANAAVVALYTKQQIDRISEAAQELQNVLGRLDEHRSPVASPKTKKKLLTLSRIFQGLPFKFPSHDPAVGNYFLSPLQFAAYYLGRNGQDLCRRHVTFQMYAFESVPNCRAFLLYCLQHTPTPRVIKTIKFLIIDLKVALYPGVLLGMDYSAAASWALARVMIGKDKMLTRRDLDLKLQTLTDRR